MTPILVDAGAINPEGTVKATFLPEEVEVEAPEGTTILDAAYLHDIQVETVCAGNGTCGKCRVLVKGYEPPPATGADNQRLSPGQLSAGWRLACQHPLIESATYIHPAVSVELKTVTSADLGEITLYPNVQKRVITLPQTNLHSASFEWPMVQESLASLLGGADASLQALRQLPFVTEKAGDGPITVAIVGNKVVSFEPGDTSDRMYGIAFDVGTTSIVGALMDLTDGTEAAVASDLNGQAFYGGDVISRMTFTQKGRKNVKALHDTVVGTINGIADRLLKEAKVSRRHVYECVFVGNTVMTHLLLNIDPSKIGYSPFVGVASDAVTTTTEMLGINLAAGTSVFVFPNIASYVGADIVAGMIAARLESRGGNVLMIDVGTNGEIALAVDGRISTTAAPAGPAFEGAEIIQGMRASLGAIERVRLDDSGVHLEVIGGGPPKGICGSGLLDVVSEMLRTGLVAPTGRLLRPEEARENCPPVLARRVFPDDIGGYFLLYGDSPESADRVILHAADIRQLQLAKGSIRCGVNALLAAAELDGGDLDEILLAGAFGTYIDPNAARAIGLVPDVETKKIKPIGNSAGLGSRMGLLSLEARVNAELLPPKVSYLELSALEDFQWKFSDALGFPDPSELSRG